MSVPIQSVSECAAWVWSAASGSITSHTTRGRGPSGRAARGQGPLQSPGTDCVPGSPRPGAHCELSSSLGDREQTNGGAGK